MIASQGLRWFEVEPQDDGDAQIADCHGRPDERAKSTLADLPEDPTKKDAPSSGSSIWGLDIQPDAPPWERPGGPVSSFPNLLVH